MSTDGTYNVPTSDGDWAKKIEEEKQQQQEESKSETPEIVVDSEEKQIDAVSADVVEASITEPSADANDAPNVNPNHHDGLDPNKAIDAQYHISMTNTNPVENAKTIGNVLSDTKLNDDQRRAIYRDKDHYINRLLQTDGNAANSLQAMFATESMSNTKDPESLTVSDKDKTSHGKKSYGPINSELSGKNAALAFTARIKGIKKVYLYNSGFYVCLRPMDLNELDSFYTEVDQDGQELGRIVGGLMFLVHDMHLKTKFMELLQSITVTSNLVGWDRKKTLMDNISIQDLDTLYWAVCSMMHKNGIKVDLICGHDECKHITHNQLMDINRMRIVDPSGMSADALKFLISDEPVKPEQLEKYRKETLDMSHTFTYNHLRFDLNVPTVGEVIRYNKDLMAEIVGATNDEYTLNNEKITRSIMINYNRNFTPWIKKISYIDDSGNVEFSCRDVSGIHAALALNDDSADEGVILHEITAFIRETKLSHVGYAVLSCAKCGKSSTDAINGYKAWDAQGLFTSLTYLKLGLIGMA